MGKYTSYVRQQPKPRNVGVHPVMRGIGCIMLVVIPILAYGVSIILVNYATTRGWPIPPSWYGRPVFPEILWNVQGLRPILQFLQAQNNLIANLIFALVITIVLFGIMAIIYGYLYSIFGPPRYGPQDAPPIRVKVKRYKR
jgi:hypothetical protein